MVKNRVQYHDRGCRLGGRIWFPHLDVPGSFYTEVEEAMVQGAALIARSGLCVAKAFGP